MPICCQSVSRTRHTTMRDDEPPLPPPSPPPTITRHPSRLRRTLHSLRSSFRSTSPFHIGSIKRANSTKSSASDSEISRNDYTMRKKNKKQRASTASDTSATSNSTNGSPIVNVKRTGSLIRRIGRNSTKQDDADTVKSSEVASSTHELPTTSKHYTPNINIDESSVKYEVKSDSIDLSSTESKDNRRAPLVSPEPISPEPTVSPIATTHKIAIKAFTKDAWKRKVKTEIPKPVEERGPESALRRRIAFVTQASMYFSEDAAEDDDDEEGGGHEVGTLEEAVKLARLQRRLETSSASAQTTPLNRSRENLSTEEEGSSEAMPPYGDLIEPEQQKQEEAAPSHASPNAERREHLYKILVIGELGTGKTSIIKRYVHQFFSQHYRATIGVDFALKVINWDANTIIRLQLWDIAGQERFGNMTRVYYKEAVGAFIVFDVSRVATFEAVLKWKNDLDTKVQLPDGSSIPCILLANKCDQQKEGVVNTPAKMDEYCREKGFAGWFETSAKENINIEEAARALVNKILLNDKLLRSNDSRDSEKFALEHKIANGENNREGRRHKSCSC